LMGRHTYSLLAALPEAARDEGWRRMTQTPTTVFSTTLTETSWPGARVHDGDVVEEVAAFKANSSDDLRTVGSLSLVRQLLRAGQVDRLRLMIFPVIVGTSGREPFFSELGDIALDLEAQTVLDDRLILLEYQPAGTPPWGVAG
jgi:dihydrofolate reductase